MPASHTCITLTGTCTTAPGEEAHLWGSGGLNGAVMSEAERAAYEEKKLKMRKAMGENLGDDVEGESISSKQRRCISLRQRLVRLVPLPDAGSHLLLPDIIYCGLTITT